MPGPSIRGSTAATATNSPTSPASTQVGDLVLVFHFTRGAAGVPTHTLQSGFTQIRSHAHDDGSTDGRLSCAYKIATSAGANAYNAYTSDTGTDFAGIVVLTAGTYHPTLIGDVQNSVTTTTNAAPDPGAVTTPQAQCLVLACAAWHLGSAATVAVTPPTNYAEVWEMAGSNTAELSVASRTIAAAGSENPGAFADDVAPNGTCSLTLCFRPLNVTMTADTGALSVTGNAVGLRADRKLSATAGSYSLMGNDGGLRAARTLAAAVGTLALVASAAGLYVGRRLVVDAGALVVTGNDAELTYEPGGYTLAVDAGAFALTGNPAGLRAARVLPTAVGALAIDAADAGLRAARRLVAEAAAVAISGAPVGLHVGRRLVAAASAFEVSGSSVGIRVDRRLVAQAGAFFITGYAVPNDEGAPEQPRCQPAMGMGLEWGL